MNNESGTVTKESTPLFPAFEAYLQETGLTASAKGDLSVKLARICGKGKTRARNLDLPPAPIERRMELISLKLLEPLPTLVQDELGGVRASLDKELRELKTSDGIRSFASRVLERLSVASGYRNNHYFAGQFVLTHARDGRTWAWSLTPHYELIGKIPPDVTYVVKAHEAAQQLMKKLIQPRQEFEKRTELAWLLARHFAHNEDVIIADVARMYKVAGQSDAFWRSPAKRYFADLPEAAFIANLIHWRQRDPALLENFEFIAATLHQALGPNARPFYMPMSEDGTDTRPFIYMKRKVGA